MIFISQNIYLQKAARTGLPDWPFLGKVLEIWPRFILVGLFLASSQVGWPKKFV